MRMLVNEPVTKLVIDIRRNRSVVEWLNRIGIAHAPSRFFSCTR